MYFLVHVEHFAEWLCCFGLLHCCCDCHNTSGALIWQLYGFFPLYLILGVLAHKEWVNRLHIVGPLVWHNLTMSDWHA